MILSAAPGRGRRAFPCSLRVAWGSLDGGVRRRPLTRRNVSLVELLALGLLGRRAVPINDHLQREDGIEYEARDEVVENERVGNFLERGEDARQRTEEVVDDLVPEI